ncbi:hypothetical protein Dda_2599 [Drechslerella dactyloides]|uniref:C2H2-type domain-containing protein n=1 Tax=Drechslerella dactyloides TaxID=74499 RepID=A0AAD6IZW0_DREDA|nr:hypothetical protein Dda_2599 [Drechslerella dactyloides]
MCSTESQCRATRGHDIPPEIRTFLELDEIEDLALSYGYCPVCNIAFTDRDTLRRHFNDSCWHIYCHICRKIFANPAQVEEHYNNHHKVPVSGCLQCKYKFSPDEDIEHHWRETGCHILCVGCGNWQFREMMDYHRIERPSCGQAYENQRAARNNLPVNRGTAARIVPWAPQEKREAPVSFICFGCGQSFETITLLVTHWESGTCPARITEADVGYTFATWRKCVPFIHEIENGTETITALWNHKKVTPTYPGAPAPFLCIGHCGSFHHLSKLLQHTESPHCPITLTEATGGLIAQLKQNVYRDSIITKFKNMRNIRPERMFAVPPDYEKPYDFKSITIIQDHISCIVAKLGPILHRVKPFSTNCGTERSLRFRSMAQTRNLLLDVRMEIAATRLKFLRVGGYPESRIKFKMSEVFFFSRGREAVIRLDCFLSEVESFLDVVQLELKK